MLDELKLKAMAIESWRRGGMDSLVKAMPKGTVPRPHCSIGFCTSFKYIAARTPAEIERIVGFAEGSKLLHGAEIFVVHPLPREHEFALCGYTQTPGGMSTSHEDYVAHPLYPPGVGAPQWNLCFYDQSHLRHILTLESGARLRYMVANLPTPQ